MKMSTYCPEGVEKIISLDDDVLVPTLPAMVTLSVAGGDADVVVRTSGRNKMVVVTRSE
jgi:hypothetical protein